MARILVIDDEPDLCALYELTLIREGHEVATSGTLVQARSQLAAHHGFDLVLTDMRLPDGSGLDVLTLLAGQQSTARSIVITAHGSAENAVEALKRGAFDYLTKPVDLAQFRAAVRDALNAASPEADATPPPAISTPSVPTAAGQAALAQLVGSSAAMRAVKTRIVQAAPSMAPVLIHGESGTGKELVARAIHACSHRHAGPFVAVNCSAIPETLLEAEFFGARKGAYTGATHDRPGFFQAAAGGTLFLDELGDLPRAMQAKLLRAIQERRVRPLGGTDEHPVDVRLLSATHKDLAAEVTAGHFREDLYYRLNVIGIDIPPLRQRRADIPAIIQALLRRIAAQSDIPQAPQLSAEQLNQLQQAPLKGNVRELENLLHRFVALGASALEPSPDAAPVAFESPAALDASPQAASERAQGAPTAPTLAAWLDAQERRILAEHLAQAGGDPAAAAGLLHMSTRQLGYRLQRLDMTVTQPADDLWMLS